MREDEKGNKKWFSVNSKSFEISVEGEGKKMKGFITKRRKGYVSWICLREEGLRYLLKGVEIFCKEESKVKKVFDWKENGRFFKLENRENEVGCFLFVFCYRW